LISRSGRRDAVDGREGARQARFVPLRHALLLAFACLIWSPSSPAQDVSAPKAYEDHGFIEPCTIANYQEMYTECELCELAGSGANECEARFGKRGYRKRCRTRPAGHGFAEVWCIEKQPVSGAAEFSQPISLYVGLAVDFALLGMYLSSRRKPTRRA
jgi:hypothetical protein